MNMGQLFNIGDVLYGFCNGYFGKDDYEQKRCVMLCSKYAVFEYDEGHATVLNYDDSFKKEDIEKWKILDEDLSF